VGESIALDRMADLSEAERQALRSLSVAVYPPENFKDWPGRRIEWADAEWGVRVHDSDGRLVSYVGITVRDGQCDGRPMRIGGIGGVKTHPAARGRGLAVRAMQRADEFFRTQAGVDFALLVCEPRLLEYYGRLGWHPFNGSLMVRQHGASAEFTFNTVMTRAVRSVAPEQGVIDLLGPPW
jgi:aminoglycoside 2'-N-acetyltransferase I